MTDFIYTIIGVLYETFIAPILDFVVNDLGYSIPIIKVGFGSVEWFSMGLDLLLFLIIGLALAFILLRLIYRFIKWLFRLGKGLVGIR